MALPFIAESLLDEIMEFYDTHTEAYDEKLVHLSEHQSGLMQYLIDEEFNSLTSEERDVILYLSVMFYTAAERVSPILSDITLDDLETAEDQNWAMIEEVPTNKFKEKLDLLFTDYPQEDMLALVEDVITDDEEKYVTQEGKEAIFVAMKSIIDCLHETA